MIQSLSFLICLSVSASVLAENWPCWRGPRGDGTSAEMQIPVAWNGETGEGIAWKVEIPGTGHSSPIVWENNLFLTTCLEDSHERMLLCLNRKDGSNRWKTSVAVSPLETKHELNMFCVRHSCHRRANSLCHVSGGRRPPSVCDWHRFIEFSVEATLMSDSETQGSTTNAVRSTESRKLFGEDELSTERDVKNFGSVDGKQI